MSGVFLFFSWYYTEALSQRIPSLPDQEGFLESGKYDFVCIVSKAKLRNRKTIYIYRLLQRVLRIMANT